MSSDPAATAPMTDERPMGVLDAPNEGRALHASLGGVVYARHPVRTHLVTAADPDAAAVVKRYVGPLGDDVRLVAVSERMVAITQGRAYPIKDIRAGPPGAPARALRDPPGLRHRARIGRDDGARDPRGRCAAHPARRGRVGGHEAVRRPRRVLSRRRAAGQGDRRARPATRSRPTTRRRRWGPRIRTRAARAIAAALDAPVAIIDANDAGCAVLGASPGVDRRFVERLFADNPLGQAREQTPICVVREVSWPAGQELPPEPKRRLTPP